MVPAPPQGTPITASTARAHDVRRQYLLGFRRDAKRPCSLRCRRRHGAAKGEGGRNSAFLLADPRAACVSKQRLVYERAMPGIRTHRAARILPAEWRGPD